MNADASTAVPQLAGPSPVIPAPRGAQAVNLADNASPWAPPNAVVQAMSAAAWQLHRYPDNLADHVVVSVANHHDLNEDQVVVAAGAMAVLEHLAEAVCVEAHHEMLLPELAFAGYDRLPMLARCRSLSIPLTKDFSLDLDATLAAITPQTRMIVLSNPHNPTGTLLETSTLQDFLDQVPENVLVVLDEAYIDYAPTCYTDGTQLAQEIWNRGQNNVAVVRTFSKSYGLAGARIGYLLAPWDVAELVRHRIRPYEVARNAQVAAVAALAEDAQDTMRTRCDMLVAERTRVLQTLRGQGYSPPESHANHVWLPIGDQAMAFEQLCSSTGVLVRSWPGLGVRATIGKRADNDLLLHASWKWVVGHP